jgi:hypothetical protein
MVNDRSRNLHGPMVHRAAADHRFPRVPEHSEAACIFYACGVFRACYSRDVVGRPAMACEDSWRKSSGEAVGDTLPTVSFRTLTAQPLGLPRILVFMRSFDAGFMGRALRARLEDDTLDRRGRSHKKFY